MYHFATHACQHYFLKSKQVPGRQYWIYGIVPYSGVWKISRPSWQALRTQRLSQWQWQCHSLTVTHSLSVSVSHSQWHWQSDSVSHCQCQWESPSVTVSLTRTRCLSHCHYTAWPWAMLRTVPSNGVKLMEFDSFLPISFVVETLSKNTWSIK